MVEHCSMVISPSVPDPVIRENTDALIRVTTTAICGSDLHLYEVLGAFMDPGDILGHEPIGALSAIFTTRLTRSKCKDTI